MADPKMVKPAAYAPPRTILDKIKAFATPKSTAGTLRDRDAEIAKKLKEAGA
jgi:hypothetical protein